MSTISSIPAENHHKSRARLLMAMRLAVILCSVLLIAMITFDTLENISFVADNLYLKVQFWCCMVFLLDVVAEIVFSVRRWHYFVKHLLFILISIPYLNIIHHFDVNVAAEWQYVLRFVPMIRAAYVFAIVTGATTSSRWVNTMLATYLIVLIVGVYFCSLTFYVAEHYVNPGVTDYWSALWWSIMSMTTVGSSIHAVTPTGRVLGVVLSAGGLILFPIFTVFLTNHMTDVKPQAVSHGASPDSEK